jgi:hypothetical protein
VNTFFKEGWFGALYANDYIHTPKLHSSTGFTGFTGSLPCIPYPAAVTVMPITPTLRLGLTAATGLDGIVKKPMNLPQMGFVGHV